MAPVISDARIDRVNLKQFQPQRPPRDRFELADGQVPVSRNGRGAIATGA